MCVTRRFLKFCVFAVSITAVQVFSLPTTDFINNPDFTLVGDLDAFDGGWSYPESETIKYDFLNPANNKYIVSADQSIYHTAAPSACITVTSIPGPVDCHLYQSVKTPGKFAGQTIQVKAWVKTEITGAEGMVQIVVHTGKTVQPLPPPAPQNWWEQIEWSTVGIAAGTTDWTEIAGEVTLSSEMTTCVFRIYLSEGTQDGSKVWVDDIFMDAPALGVRYSVKHDKIVPQTGKLSIYNPQGRILKGVDARDGLLKNGLYILDGGQKASRTIMLPAK
jgi:hypothetical protein